MKKQWWIAVGNTERVGDGYWLTLVSDNPQNINILKIILINQSNGSIAI